MTKVMWFSRHEMTDDQKHALEVKLGEIELVKIDKTINNAYELKEEIDGADVIAVVAPINLQQQFLKLAGGKPVITAKSNRKLVPQENGESQVVFEFEKWERLLKIEVVLEDFA